MHAFIFVVVVVISLFSMANASAFIDLPTDAVVIAPLFYQRFACTEHVSGELTDLGDALGSDCLVLGDVATHGSFLRLYKTNGKNNEDWYGWHAEVHAPFDGIVLEAATGHGTNIPGTPGKPPPGFIRFKRADGLIVVYAHLDDIRVREGDHVAVGQVVGLCGNNGSAKNPHVHVGAYMHNKPIQIRWDLVAEGRIPTLVHPE